MHPFRELHRSDRSAWLRAAVLGANDGIVSTASLMVGVAASSAKASQILTAGLAGLVAGAMAMAAGEFVSVSSQRDVEHSDLRREATELHLDPESELDELTMIYVRRGLNEPLARDVAIALHQHDALGAHTRDELGLTERTKARPAQAATWSAGSFATGSIVPLLALAVTPKSWHVVAIVVLSLVALVGLGWLSARIGRAPAGRAALRVLIGGAAAMGITAAVGQIVGAVVS